MTQPQKKERLHAQVEGTVQGVGFRFFVIQRAGDLNLTGWVRNLWDGRVEVTAEGSKLDLEVLLKYLKEGPGSANVTKVTVEWLPATNEFENFDVLSSHRGVSD